MGAASQPARARTPVPGESWEAQAACRGHALDPEHWTGEGDTILGRERQAKAVAVCHACPVRAECLEWALRTEQDHGVLGGLTPDQREALT